MVDLEVLKGRGITSDSQKKIFTATKGDDVKVATKIRNRIRDRVYSGLQYNLSNYRYWHACDLAWDVPFRQTTYTILKGLIDKRTPDKDILSALEGADLNEMVTIYDKSGKVVTSRVDPKEVGEVKVNAPTFFHIFIPLAKAYTTIRAAAIVNSYRQVPLFKYEASKSTEANRLKSDIITDRVELMSNQYGYYDVLKQAILHMLHYSMAIMFPAEAWDSEKQTWRVPKENESGNATGETEEKEVTAKEGLRFNLPHPSRIFIDSAFRPSTINSDSGVKFGAYWRIDRIGNVMTNTMYWNNDKITDNGWDLRASNPAFFNTVYQSCALKFGPTGTSDKGDRETKLSYYTANEPDRAVTFTEYFEKVNPLREGLGNYDGEVWFRYCVAGNDTVIYSEPLPYCPMVYFGYDALETRAQNASMTLEVLPFQDQISNLFTQYLLTVKQNLANVTFFDTNQVDKTVIDDIRNLGQKNYTANNYMPMDMRTNRMGGNDITKAFQTFQFTHQPTDGLIEGITELLKVLERVMVISPQELAQTATHELTAEEVKNMNAAKSTRYEFTAGAVDRGVYALKKMIYEGLMAYGDEDVFARVAQPVDPAALLKLGFTVDHFDNHSKSAMVKGKKTTLMVESFMSSRDGDLRTQNTQIAQTMTQTLTSIVGNEALFMEVGAKQVIALINEICQIAGLPRDFRFTPTGNLEAAQKAQAQQPPPQQQPQAQQPPAPQGPDIQQQLQQVAQQLEQKIMGDIAQQLKPVFEQEAQKISGIEQEVQQLAQLLVKLTHTQNATPSSPPPIAGGPVDSPPPLAIPPGSPVPPPGA